MIKDGAMAATRSPEIVDQASKPLIRQPPVRRNAAMIHRESVRIHRCYPAIIVNNTGVAENLPCRIPGGVAQS